MQSTNYLITWLVIRNFSMESKTKLKRNKILICDSLLISSTKVFGITVSDPSTNNFVKMICSCEKYLWKKWMMFYKCNLKLISLKCQFWLSQRMAENCQKTWEVEIKHLIKSNLNIENLSLTCRGSCCCLFQTKFTDLFLLQILSAIAQKQI